MWWLEQVDAANFDRIVSFDPLIAETAAERAAACGARCRSPSPTACSWTCASARSPPRLLFVGRSTEHREQLLAPVKRAHPIVHIGHGLFGEQLLRFLRGSDVQLNLHNNPYPSFENRVCIALAAGHLVISEPLSPQPRADAGTRLSSRSTHPAELLALVDELAREPDAFSEVQAAGRVAGRALSRLARLPGARARRARGRRDATTAPGEEAEHAARRDRRPAVARARPHRGGQPVAVRPNAATSASRSWHDAGEQARGAVLLGLQPPAHADRAGASPESARAGRAPTRGPSGESNCR